MTPLQTAMLGKIAAEELNGGNGRPEKAQETETYADMIIETAQDKGVFTSLQNAGLVWHDGQKGREAGVGMTAEGFAAWVNR
jgi:hypothetical protein